MWQSAESTGVSCRLRSCDDSEGSKSSYIFKRRVTQTNLVGVATFMPCR